MVATIPSKTILQTVSYNGDFWFGMDYNVNLYRGCSFGCIYCDSRSECYRNDDFDTIKVKEKAILILENELRRKQRRGIVALGAMSDSYNPLETSIKVTRSALQLFAKYGFGVSFETKSALVTRDIDVLQNINQRNNCIIKFSITTSDDELCQIIEPRASLSSERFKAMQQVAQAGLFTGVLMTPLLPFINDTEKNIQEIVRLTAEHGGKFVYSMFGVTLRDRQRNYFYEALEKNFPDLKQQYMETYGNTYSCFIPQYREKRKIFEEACQKYGLLYKMEDIIKAYKVNKEEITQLKLF